jgi:hypothetical protein
MCWWVWNHIFSCQFTATIRQSLDIEHAFFMTFEVQTLKKVVEYIKTIGLNYMVLKGYFWQIFTQTIILKKWLFVTKVTNLDNALVHFWSLTKNDQIFFRDFGPKRLLLTNFYTNHNSENMTFSCHKSHQPPRLCLGTFLKFDKKWSKIFFVILVFKGYFWQILHKL